MKATAEVRKALQTKLEEMIRNEEPVKEVDIAVQFRLAKYRVLIGPTCILCV